MVIIFLSAIVSTITTLLYLLENRALFLPCTLELRRQLSQVVRLTPPLLMFWKSLKTWLCHQAQGSQGTNTILRWLHDWYIYFLHACALYILFFNQFKLIIFQKNYNGCVYITVAFIWLLYTARIHFLGGYMNLINRSGNYPQRGDSSAYSLQYYYGLSTQYFWTG